MSLFLCELEVKIFPRLVRLHIHMKIRYVLVSLPFDVLSHSLSRQAGALHEARSGDTHDQCTLPCVNACTLCVPALLALYKDKSASRGTLFGQKRVHNVNHHSRVKFRVKFSLIELQVETEVRVRLK